MMNISSGIDEEVLLQQLNDEKAVMMIPVIVYLCILMIFGLTGNAMVCFYYGFKARQSSNTIFIVAVATFDIMVCGLAVPIEIVDIRLFYQFTNDGTCKFMRFINYFGTIGSAFTLIVISADRFRKICKPFKTQLKLRGARISWGLSVLVSVILSWPALLLYGSAAVDVPAGENITLIGHDCTTLKEGVNKIYLNVFNAFYVLCFLTLTTSLCVLYGMVCRVLFKHNKMIKQLSGHKIVTPKETASYESGTQSTELDHSFSQGTTNINTVNTDVNKHKIQSFKGNGNANGKVFDLSHLKSQQYRNELKENSRECETNLDLADLPQPRSSVDRKRWSTKSRHGNQSIKHPNAHLDRKTVKFTIMMLVITIVFVLSFLPYLILSVWRAFQKEYEVNILSDSELIAFQIGLRSFFLNSAINPFVYGFFNPKFRHYFREKLCSFKRQHESSTASSSSVVTH